MAISRPRKNRLPDNQIKNGFLHQGDLAESSWTSIRFSNLDFGKPIFERPRNRDFRHFLILVDFDALLKIGQKYSSGASNTIFSEFLGLKNPKNKSRSKHTEILEKFGHQTSENRKYQKWPKIEVKILSFWIAFLGKLDIFGQKNLKVQVFIFLELKPSKTAYFKICVLVP